MHRALLALPLLLALSACNQAPAEPEATTETEEETQVVSLPVEVTPVNVDSIGSYYATTAILEAPEEAMVVNRVSGIITAIAVEEGDQVKAGQLLAQIDPKRYEYNLKKAQAELNVIDQELERMKQIANKQLVSEETMARLEYRRLSALADLELAQLELNYSRITAPFDGVIANRMVKRGNMAELYSTLFHLVHQSELHGILHLPERELEQIQKGQLAELELSDHTNAYGTVTRISPVVDAATGTFKVTLTIDNQQDKLKAGMLAKAKLKYASHDHALVIPRHALLRQDRGHAVFVIQEGKAQRREVSLGFEDNGLIEILDGLGAGEQVVTRGQHQLKQDAVVEVIDSLQLAQH